MELGASSEAALDDGDMLPADSAFLDEGGLHVKNTDRLALLQRLNLDGSVRSSVEVLDEFLSGFVIQGSAAAPLYSSMNALPRAPPPPCPCPPCALELASRTYMYLALLKFAGMSNWQFALFTSTTCVCCLVMQHGPERTGCEDVLLGRSR